MRSARRETTGEHWSATTQILLDCPSTRTYPEVVFPIQALDGIANRCNGQLYKGHRTHIGWTAKEVVLPTIPDSVANLLTQNAESECSRLFALKARFPRVCGDAGCDARLSVPNRLLSGSGSNHGGWARTPPATLSNSLTLSLTSATP